jgi:hypothetical protein
MRALLLGILAGIVALLIVSQTGGAAAPRQSSVYSAVVNLDGSLARGRGAVSAFANGVDGQYEVTFGVNVSTCTYVASGGEATALSPDDAVVFTVAPAQDSANNVFVQEWDGVLARDSYSSGFHLVVVC